jgi:hypothetical protein
MGASLIACENIVGEFLEERSLTQLSLYLLPSSQVSEAAIFMLYFSACHMDVDDSF